MIKFPQSMKETENKPLPLELDNSLSYWELVKKVTHLCDELLALEKHLEIELKAYTDEMKDAVNTEMENGKTSVLTVRDNAIKAIANQIESTRKELGNVLTEFDKYIANMISSAITELKAYADTSAGVVRTQSESDKKEVTDYLEDTREYFENEDGDFAYFDYLITRDETDLPQKISDLRAKFAAILTEYAKSLVSGACAALGYDIMETKFYDPMYDSLKLKS